VHQADTHEHPPARSRQDGKTALQCATSDDAYEVAKLLLDSGASMDAQDKVGAGGKWKGLHTMERLG